MMIVLESFLAGVFLFNAIPHLVQGICGRKHMTPFARVSSPAVNVVWAWVNLVVGTLIARASDPLSWTCSTSAAFGLGGVLTSTCLAVFWSNPEARLPWHKQGGFEERLD